VEYKDYYKILGIDKSASIADIKKAYRKLAMQHHPDVNSNNKEAAAKFAEINEANEVLSNDEKRKRYDALGSDWQRYQGAGQREDFDWSKYASPKGGTTYTYYEGEPFAEEKFSDFFKNIFGHTEGARYSKGVNFPFKGADYYTELNLTLEDIYKECIRVIQVKGKNLRITLDRGLRDGQIIRLKGKGGEGANGGENGDLYITIKVALHPYYTRKDSDLFVEVPISIYKALLGGEVEVDTLRGKIKLKIPPETDSGITFRIKGKGFPVYKKKGEFGDLYAKVILKIPKNLTKKEKELFSELEKMRRGK